MTIRVVWVLYGAEKISSLAEKLPVEHILCTHIPFPHDHLGELMISPDGPHKTSSKKLVGVPRGAGDLYAATFMGCLLQSGKIQGSMFDAHTIVHKILKASTGQGELKIVEHQHIFDY